MDADVVGSTSIQHHLADITVRACSYEICRTTVEKDRAVYSTCMEPIE
jgi:hypothetical protein